MSGNLYNNPPEDHQDIDDAFPEKVDEESEYVEAAPGHYVETGLDKKKYTVQHGRLEGTQRTFQRLHCCNHVVKNNVVGVCHVGKKTICDRPDCSAWCHYCRNLVCRRHYIIDPEHGVPICDKCLSRMSGPPLDIRFFFAVAIMIVIFVIYYLFK